MSFFFGGSGTTGQASNTRPAITNSSLTYVAPPGPHLPAGYGTCASGTMKVRWSSSSSSAAIETIEIRYDIPSDIQKQYHPNPGVQHSSVTRTAYLPVENSNYNATYLLCIRLQYAFLHGHCLTVGRSITSRRDNQICWNVAVPHKTTVMSSSSSGHQNPFALPDPNYNTTLHAALTNLGVPTSKQQCEQWIQQYLQPPPPQQQPTGAGVGGSGPAATNGTAAVGSQYIPTPFVPPSAPAAAAAAAAPPAFAVPASIAVPTAPVATAVPTAPVATSGSSSAAQPAVNPDYEPDSRFVVPTNQTFQYNAPQTVQLNVNEIWEPYNPDQGSEEDCPICMDSLNNGMDVVRTKRCQPKHPFHRECLTSWLQGQAKSKCPSCNVLITSPQGPGPSGTMRVSVDRNTTFCEGQYGGMNGPQIHPIVISYSLPSGTQTSYMEHSGQRYSGASREAYVPNTQAGRRLLKRLIFAFMHGLSFKVGTSITSGRTNTVTWTSVHHKTSLHSGSSNYGYPDCDYVRRCNEELDHLHVPKAEDCP